MAYWTGSHTVDLHSAVSDHLLDLALLFQVLETRARQRPVNLQSVNESRNCDEAVRLHILVQFVGCDLVENDGMLGLVLD